ncbi:MAG: hypothetical protein VX833_09445 [Actinomycetota bacterium]|nr:hypothetical protein [Actinomycetota bacterium]
MNSARDRWIMWIIKLFLGGCLLAGLLFPNIPGVEGKGWPERCIGYPFSALVIPIVWHLRGRRSNYPYLADGLLVSPFALDLFGNLVNLFDTVDVFDDALHFVNWTLLVAAFVLLLDGRQLQRWNVVLLGVGFGAMAIIAWEAVEWVIQEMGTAGLQLTYDDTVGDLVLSTVGGAVGAAVASRAVSEFPKQSPL